MALFMSNMLNEYDTQLVVKTKVKVMVETPFLLKIPFTIKPRMLVTCGHVPCNATICKYLCQVSVLHSPP